MITRTPMTGPTKRLRSNTSWPNAQLVLLGTSVALLASICLSFLIPCASWSGSWIGTTFTTNRTLPLLITTSSPNCASEAYRQAELLLAQGQWERAESAASEALSHSTACPTVTQALLVVQRKAVLETVLTNPVDPSNTVAQTALAVRYRLLRQSLPDMPLAITDLQIARQAYDAQKFAVARAAFELAWEHGTFPHNDQSLVQQYTSTLYNLAVWYLAGPEYLHAEAAHLLVASFCIERTSHLSWIASADLLNRTVSTDPARWPAPAATPLLDGVSCGR